VVHLESVPPHTPRRWQRTHQFPLRTACVADGSARETSGFASRSGSHRLRLGEAAMRKQNSWRCITPDTAPREARRVVFWTGRRRAQRRRRYDCFVTEAECARRQIPDAPLPRLCGGPAYEL